MICYIEVTSKTDLAIVLSVLRFKDSDYPFGISKLFLAATQLKRWDIIQYMLHDNKGVIGSCKLYCFNS